MYTVSITVNNVNRPHKRWDSYNMIEDTALNVPSRGVGQRHRPEGDQLTAIKLTNPQHGTLNLNSNGSFVYTPTPGFTGNDSFTYKANDGALDSNVATVSITVNPFNTPPQATADNYSTAEDTTLNVPPPGVLGNDTDPEDNLLTAHLVQGPSQGILNLYPDGSFSYIPDTNVNGEVSFSYKANDGQEDSNIATVNLTITPVNDAPHAENQAITTEEDTPKVIVLSAFDEEDDPLTFSVIDKPRHGTLSGDTPNLLYTPLPGYHGLDSLTFRVNDGTTNSNIATVSITVTDNLLTEKIYLSVVLR
jgi:VCBS repeat-containing protein